MQTAIEETDFSIEASLFSPSLKLVNVSFCKKQETTKKEEHFTTILQDMPLRSVKMIGNINKRIKLEKWGD